MIVQKETYKYIDWKKKEHTDQVNKEGWKQLREMIFQKPYKVVGRRRRKVRKETPAEDGHWMPRADGSLTLSLPISKFRRDILREMGRVRGVSPEEEVARIVQEAVKDDYRPRSEEEWVAEQKAMMRESWQVFRDILRYILSGSKRR